MIRAWPNSSNESHANVHTEQQWEELLEELRPAAGDAQAVEDALRRFAQRFF